MGVWLLDEAKRYCCACARACVHMEMSFVYWTNNRSLSLMPSATASGDAVKEVLVGFAFGLELGLPSSCMPRTGAERYGNLGRGNDPPARPRACAPALLVCDYLLCAKNTRPVLPEVGMRSWKTDSRDGR